MYGFAATRAIPGCLVALTGSLCLVVSSPAMADESRERQLEERIADLERRLTDVAEQQARQNAGDESELSSRVAELEKLTKKDKDGLFWYWSKGMRAASADKKFAFKFGGRIMNDWVFWSSDRDTEAVVGDQLTTATEFRRARLYLEGAVYDNVSFKAQYDFAGGDADFKDVWMAYKTPVGKVKVGHHYMPMGLEEQTSSKYISVMERGLHNTFVPSRKTGLSVGDRISDTNFIWRAGVFRASNGYGDDTGNMGEGEWNWAARVAGRPFVSDEGDQYVHVGASCMLNDFADETVRYRARPQVHTGPRFVDTGSFMAHDGRTMAGELAFVSGPFHAQAEYIKTEVDALNDPTDPTVNGGDVDLDGWTVQAGFFITGENRKYKGSSAKFDRTSPKKNWGEDDGMGAWEVVLSRSEIDLDDNFVTGGKLQTTVIGLNWYLNPNTRIMLNYVMADTDRNDGGTPPIEADDVDAVQIRFQIDF